MKVKESIDWTKVIETCEKVMKAFETGDFDDEFDNYGDPIVAYAMTAVYGEEVVEYLSKRFLELVDEKVI